MKLKLEISAVVNLGGGTYLVDVHVLSNGGTDIMTESVDDVDDTRRETGFLSKLCKELCAQGSNFRGLEDDGVTGREGRSDLPRKHKHCGSTL